MSEYQYYDAHFYIANWGSVRFALSFPEGVLDLETVQPYVRGHEQYENTLTIESNGARTIACWERHEEGGWGWIDGEGIISRLVGIREELMRGDYRAFFLGWLADFHPDEWRDPRECLNAPRTELRGVSVLPLVVVREPALHVFSEPHIYGLSSGVPSRSFDAGPGPSTPFGLRRGSLRSALAGPAAERRLVEAGGIEPPSA